MNSINLIKNRNIKYFCAAIMTALIAILGFYLHLISAYGLKICFIFSEILFFVGMVAFQVNKQEKNTNNRYKILFFIVLIGTIALFFDVRNVKSITKEENNVNISIDPRIELLGVVSSLSNKSLVDSDYINDEFYHYNTRISNYFKNFADDKAVKTFEKLTLSGYSYEKILTSILQSDTKDERIQKFIEELNDFAKKSKYSKFYRICKEDYYAYMIDNAIKYKAYTKMDDYSKDGKYNIILNPTVKNHVEKIKIDDDTYYILGRFNNKLTMWD